MTSNHNYECFNGGCHGMAANVYRLNAVFKNFCVDFVTLYFNYKLKPYGV